MSTVPETVAAVPTVWTPPFVHPGETVYHCPDGTVGSTYPAMVLRVNKRTIDLWTIGGVKKDAVRNINDPKLTTTQIEDFGCWTLSHTSMRLTELEEKVKCLFSEIRVLAQALAQKTGTDAGPRAKPADNIQGRKP